MVSTYEGTATRTVVGFSSAAETRASPRWRPASREGAGDSSSDSRWSTSSSTSSSASTSVGRFRWTSPSARSFAARARISPAVSATNTDPGGNTLGVDDRGVGAGSAYCAKLSSQPSLALTSDATGAPIPSLVCTARRSSMISSAAFSGEASSSRRCTTHTGLPMPARFTIKVSVVYDRDAVRRMWSFGPRGVDGRDTRGTARAPARASASAPAVVDDLADDGRGFLSFPRASSSPASETETRRFAAGAEEGRPRDGAEEGRARDGASDFVLAVGVGEESESRGVGSSSAAAAGAATRGFREGTPKRPRRRVRGRRRGATARMRADRRRMFSFTTSVYPVARRDWARARRVTRAARVRPRRRRTRRRRVLWRSSWRAVGKP